MLVGSRLQPECKWMMMMTINLRQLTHSGSLKYQGLEQVMQ